ncbi:BamA/TamA family outer membrane protein [Marivirga sp. S37H4]|uniref:BamA/TamA family outer membrane protein n=1 Tax=Marivirga aurantiaca TaxID=2802615 RepID=A0A934WVP4_9BACT|nr:BamA/TamA family outer membrane protein [Marivirga aurantiaca]MBK6263797.1 BamA/TamA family outer membrane protein [Marivirga aurantiaca]
MEYRFKFTLIGILFILVATTGICQDTTLDAPLPIDSSKLELDKNSLFPLPVVYYTPESGLFFGASLLYNFYIDREKPINASQIQLAAGYTTKDQLLIFFPFQLYWNKNKWRSIGELGFYNYAYPFYGVGNNNHQEIYSTYRALFPRARIFFLKELKPNLYVGARYWFENYDIIQWEENSDFVQEEVEGAIYNRTSGIGPALIYDTRDGVYYPTSGHYLESYLEINHQYTGSTHNYTAISFDYAYYYPLFDKTVIAANAYSLSNFGTVPFNRLAQLGGNKKMRGYFQGFFQDKNLLLGQLEVRQELFWRIGMTAFASTGQVAEKLDEFGMNRWNFAGGAGLRFRFDTKKKINVRLDYAIGKNSNGFYISFNEAF